MVARPAQELIIDSFAGGGGASTGIEMALGRSPDYAINHDAAALALHQANHPDTEHLSKNIWQVDPLDVVGRRPVGLAWFSPDCKHFSKAKGGAPVKRNIRDLAWVVCLWAKRVKPRVILLENVEEFQTWGPLTEDGRPCKVRAGETFKAWVKELRRHGYRVEWREMRACDYGAPTIRKRLFVIARRDKRPIVWPKPTHGAPDSLPVRAGKLTPWRTAAEIIDWSLPCPSIFDTSEEIMRKHGVRAKRPLADATLARIARGVHRYVLEAAQPFLVSVAHGESGGRREYPLERPLGTLTGSREHALVSPIVTYAQQGGANRSAESPLHTITASSKDQNALVAPYLVPRYGERPGQAPRCLSVDAPLPVDVPTGNGASLVSAFLAQHNGGERMKNSAGRDAREPLSTLTGAGAQQQVVAASMLNLRGTDREGVAADLPVRTITQGSHAGVVAAFLQSYYGTDQDTPLSDPLHTDTTKPRHGLVTVEIAGQPYAIVDIGMRMLTPRERFRAQGFPDSYIIDRGINPDGSPHPLTLEKQGRACGNSVCPPLAQALVAANCADMVVGASRYAAE
ncbi:DNA cytosine methyltransferase [uncultured Zoogloea sp.]|uniref:DNA cytosine methyltransferase n=1 Tax=uncultured Zoogloea sp. TaxID=160237 RepID=UPI0026101FC8|nr:DNA cytosine methyltransferase [uncultured Zoogloea sp.]